MELFLFEDNIVGTETSENGICTGGSLCGSSGSGTDRSQLRAEQAHADINYSAAFL